MLKLMRQCATIQITVKNENDVMVFDQSCSAEAPGYLEYQLREAIKHEERVIEGRVANQFHDRIAQLQRELAKYKKGAPSGALRDGNVMDAEFSEVKEKRAAIGAKVIALPAPRLGDYDA